MFLELVLVRVAGAVLIGGRVDRKAAGGRLVAAGLDVCLSPSDADLDLDGAGLCAPRPCSSATDLDRCLTLWLSGLGAGCFGSAAPAWAFDFQMDPIFDWTTLPLYVPRAGLDVGAGAGGFGASAAIILCLTAC